MMQRLVAQLSAVLVVCIIQSLGALADERYQLNLTWGGNTSWKGMTITNTGEETVRIVSAILNNRDDCSLRLFDVRNINLEAFVNNRSGLGELDFLVLYGKVAGADLDTSFVLGDPKILVEAEEKLGVPVPEATSVELQVGQRLALTRSGECNNIVRVKVRVEGGEFSWRLNPPFQE